LALHNCRQGRADHPNQLTYWNRSNVLIIYLSLLDIKRWFEMYLKDNSMHQLWRRSKSKIYISVKRYFNRCEHFLLPPNSIAEFKLNREIMKYIYNIIPASMILLSACNKSSSDQNKLSPGHYALNADKAYENLIKSELPDLILNRQCGILIHAKVEGQPGKSVTWRITSNYRTKPGTKEVVNFTATLTPVVQNRTKIDISISKEQNGREAYDGTQFYPRPAFRQPIRPAIEEQILALLEGRKYDPKKVDDNIDEFELTFGAKRNDAADILRDANDICNIQRAGLEGGENIFSIDDLPGNDSKGSAHTRIMDEAMKQSLEAQKKTREALERGL
jgi:hypothetical protein